MITTTIASTLQELSVPKSGVDTRIQESTPQSSRKIPTNEEDDLDALYDELSAQQDEWDKRYELKHRDPQISKSSDSYLLNL